MDFSRPLRTALMVGAALGWLACLAVVVFQWPSWTANPGWAQAALWLGVLAAGTAAAFLLQRRGLRALSLMPAVLMLLLGWVTTWVFGFAWVPGVCALLAAALPTALRPDPVEPVAS